MSDTDKDKEDLEKETRDPDNQPEEQEEGHDLAPGDIPIAAESGEGETGDEDPPEPGPASTEEETAAEAGATVSVKSAEAETAAGAGDESKDKEEEGKGEKGEEKTPAEVAYGGLGGKILDFSRAVWGRSKSFLARIVPASIWRFAGQNKKVVFIILACFLILGTAVFSFLLGRRYYSHSSLSSPSEGESAKAVIKGERYSLKPFLIPFNEGGTDVFLRVRVDFVTEEGVAPEIRRKELMLREAIYAFFLSKKLDAVQQGQNDKALADELRRVLNNYLKPKKIQKVLFVDYVFT
ncbi:MAG: flagellar basal body-associated FliL family protein [Deltaproteobacteria bacterium]|nr:flagellar basal body-associated FliL family protein [Deltaproteobacteria bacterium]